MKIAKTNHKLFMEYVYFVDNIYDMYLPSKIKCCVNAISFTCTIHNKRIKGTIVKISGVNKIRSILTRNNTYITILIKLFQVKLWIL